MHMHPRGYGATAARLTPDQKFGSSNLSGLSYLRLEQGRVGLVVWMRSELRALDMSCNVCWAAARGHRLRVGGGRPAESNPCCSASGAGAPTKRPKKAKEASVCKSPRMR